MITIVTPCYNAACFLPAYIDSVIQQSVDAWKLIIVDDCSTDGSWDILTDYAQKDARITIHRLEKNSGSAKFPRDTAVSMADTPWVCAIDADDYIEPDYIKKILARQQETDADIVTARMQAFNNDNPCVFTVPKGNFNMSQVFTAEEALCLTLNGWELAMNGALIRRDIWQKGKDYLSTSFKHMNADEYASREMLALSSSVACVDAIYHYRLNPTSITHKPEREWERIYTHERLILLAKERFGEKSTALAKARLAYVEELYRLLRWHLNATSGEAAEILLQHLRAINVRTILQLSTSISKRIKYLRHFYRWKKTLLH